MGDIYELVGAPSGLISSPDEPRLNFPLPLVRSRNRNDYYPYHINWGLIPGLGLRLEKALSLASFQSS